MYSSKNDIWLSPAEESFFIFPRPNPTAIIKNSVATCPVTVSKLFSTVIPP